MLYDDYDSAQQRDWDRMEPDPYEGLDDFFGFCMACSCALTEEDGLICAGCSGL
jgi:hypothetical protein